jgi:hypothetical protein
LGAAGFGDRQSRSSGGQYELELLEHITAGMQYLVGDLPADDRPSIAGAK